LFLPLQTFWSPLCFQPSQAIYNKIKRFFFQVISNYNVVDFKWSQRKLDWPLLQAVLLCCWQVSTLQIMKVGNVVLNWQWMGWSVPQSCLRTM
jgi:hypothetical protein